MGTRRRIVKLAGICFIVFLGFVLTTRPSDLPAPLLVVPFLLLFLGLLLVSYVLLNGLRVMKGRSLQFALLVAGFPTVLLALQSVGQLSWRDLITITVLFGVGYVYLSRMTKVEG
jgi:hypothetical protein